MNRIQISMFPDIVPHVDITEQPARKPKCSILTRRNMGFVAYTIGKDLWDEYITLDDLGATGNFRAPMDEESTHKRRIIVKCLIVIGYSISQIANEMNMNRRTIYNIDKRYDINYPQYAVVPREQDDLNRAGRYINKWREIAITGGE